MSDSSIQPSSLIKPSTDSTSTLVIPTPAFPSFNSFPAQFLPALQDVTTSAWVEPTAKTYSTLSSDSDTHSFKQLKKSKKRSHKHKSSKSKNIINETLTITMIHHHFILTKRDVWITFCTRESETRIYRYTNGSGLNY
ncbi:hypothetical protein MT418_007000 [Batrachochytrium dendrobatidis]